MKITIDEYLKGREKEYPLNEQQWRNMCILLVAINQVRRIWNKPMIVTSGYRPGHYNEQAGGAPNSAHLTCEAIDIADPQGELYEWLRNNEPILYEFGLYMENKVYTPTWVHLQTRKTSTRIFKK